MPLLNLVTVLCLAAAALAATPAIACGPDFPNEYLSVRIVALSDLPTGSFSYEAARLVPPPANNFRVDGKDDAKAREGGGVQETAIYKAGAAAFHSGDMDAAQEQFRRVLALPPTARKRFSTFAAFMLGRLAKTADEQKRYFNEVRDLARRGFDDPVALAVESFGEEARGHLHRGDDVGAVRLYAEQAAIQFRRSDKYRWDGAGAASLLFVARALVVDPPRMKKTLKDPLIQRLLTAFAWTDDGDSWEADEGFAWTKPGQLAETHPERLEKSPKNLLDLLAALTSLRGADRLAARAWHDGKFDIAERFAEKEKTALALWVQAKIALRKGDRGKAERLTAEVGERLSNGGAAKREYIGYEDLGYRAWAEAGVLALARGDFGTALSRAVASCSWPDIAFLGERVLTADELKSYIVEHEASLKSACDWKNDWFRQEAKGDKSVFAGLKAVLARRLLRTGHWDEALPAFEGSPYSQFAHQYVAEREKAENDGDKVTQAQSLLHAAKIVRQHGLEILGTETEPDWGWVRGQFDVNDYWNSSDRLRAFGFEFSPPTWNDEANRKAMAAFVVARAEVIHLQPVATLVSDAERQRVAASAPPHPERFHYRETAADLAEQSAALVPDRSKARALLLCHAASFVFGNDGERFNRIWRTYLRRSYRRSIPWVFGRRCPEPDFGSARAN